MERIQVEVDDGFPDRFGVVTGVGTGMGSETKMVLGLGLKVGCS